MFPETSRFCSKYLDKVLIKYLKNICLYLFSASYLKVSVLYSAISKLPKISKHIFTPCVPLSKAFQRASGQRLIVTQQSSP